MGGVVIGERKRFGCMKRDGEGGGWGLKEGLVIGSGLFGGKANGRAGGKDQFSGHLKYYAWYEPV